MFDIKSLCYQRRIFLSYGQRNVKCCARWTPRLFSLKFTSGTQKESLYQIWGKFMEWKLHDHITLSYVIVHSLHLTYTIYYVVSQIQSTRNNNEPIFKIHTIPFSRWATFVKQLTSQKNEAIATSTLSQWASMLQVMALSSLVKRTVFSVYPDVSHGICPLFHGGNFFQNQHMSWHQRSVTRSACFDNKPGFPFHPNHFVPLSRGISYFHSLDAFPASRSSSPVLVSSSDHQQSSCPASSGNSLWSHTSPFHLRK